MILYWPGKVFALITGLILAFSVVVATSISTMIGAILLPALVIGIYLIFLPFAGLILLTVFAQLDAIGNLASGFLPISLYKILTITTLCGFGLMSFRQTRDLRLGPPTQEMRYAVLFGLIMGMSFLFCKYPSPGLTHIIGFVSVMLLFFLIIVMVDTPQKLEILMWVLLLSGFFSSIIVLLETFLGIRLLSSSQAAATASFEGQARSAGASDYNPTTAAHMLLATTIIAGVMLVQHPRMRWLSFLALVVGIVALVLTFARSAVVAFAVIAVIFAWQNRQHKLFAFSLCLILLVMAAAVPFVPDLFWTRMWTLVDIGLDRTLLRRISYNLIGLELLAQHPILGIGPGNFPFYYASDEFRWFPGREPLPRQLHNTYLEVAAETGLLGLSAFLAVMISSLRRAVQAAAANVGSVSAMARALSYAFGAFLVASVFMPNEDTKFMWILPGLCVASWRLAVFDRRPDRAAFAAPAPLAFRHRKRAEI